MFSLHSTNKRFNLILGCVLIFAAVLVFLSFQQHNALAITCTGQAQCSVDGTGHGTCSNAPDVSISCGTGQHEYCANSDLPCGDTYCFGTVQACANSFYVCDTNGACVIGSKGIHPHYEADPTCNNQCPTPTPTPSPIPLSCTLSGGNILIGGTVTATAHDGAGAPGYYFTAPGASFVGATNESVDLQYDSPGTYSVDVATAANQDTAHCGDVTVANAPLPGVSLSASPASGQYPTAVTLGWSTTNSPDTCVAGGDWSGGKSASGGSEGVGNPAIGSHSYTITCSNTNGVASDSVGVTIDPPTLSCSLSNGTISQGGNVDASATGGVGSYTWSTPGATVSGSGANIGLQYLNFGSYSVDVSTSSSGQSAHCGDVTVNPNGPYVNLGATPNPVNSGNPTTLSWDSGYVTSCTATQGAGFSTGGAVSGSDASSALTNAETFIVTCSGPNGTASDSVTVYVNSPPGTPPSCTSSAPESSTTTAISGVFFVYAYGVTNATSVTFPTWGDVGGQDDLVWYAGTNLGSGTWRASINLANHKAGNPEYGNINSHIYMSNSSFTNTWCGTANFTRTFVAPTPTPTVTPTPTPAPTATLTASPSPVEYGYSTTLTWTSQNTVSCTEAFGAGFATGGATSGADASTALTGLSTFRMNCLGLDGSTVTKEISVPVNIPTLSCSFSPSTIPLGQPVTATAYDPAFGATLFWSYGGAYNVTQSGNTLTLTYAAPGTYTVSATTSPQGSASCSVTVTALPAPTVALTASPNSGSYPTPVTLSWVTGNSPSSCFASSSHNDWTGSKSISGGSENIGSPTAATHTYTIVCSNANGVASDSQTVVISSIALPPAVSLSASQSSGLYPTNITLTWTPSNSPDSCTATSSTGDWVGSKLATNSPHSESLVPLVGVHTYTITCPKSGFTTATATTTVTITSLPPTVSLTYASNPVAYNTPAQLFWTSNYTTSCTATQGAGFNTANAVSGTDFSSNLTASETFSITCTGPAGIASDSVVINVGSQPSSPVSCSITTPNPLYTNTPITATATGGLAPLFWSVPGGTPNSGTGNSFTTQFSSQGNYTFTVSSSGTPLQTNTCTAFVLAPPPPPSVTLWTNTTSGVYPTAVSAYWFTTGSPTSCIASGDAGWTGSKDPSGNFFGQSLGNPAVGVHTYILTCSNASGVGSDTTTVTITASPPVCSPATQTVVVGQVATLTATSGNNTYAWSATGASPSSGSGSSFSASYASTGFKTITLTSAGQSTTCNVQVNNAPTPPTVTLLASPSSATLGTPVNLTWTVGNSPESCTATSSTGDWSGSKSAVNGSHTDTLTPTLGSHDYTIICINSTTTPTTVSDTRTVVINPALVMTCSVSPASVVTGQSTTATALNGVGSYTWTAPSATITGAGSSVTLSYATQGTYAVSVTTSTGQSASCGNVTVTNSATPANVIASDKDIISVGGKATPATSGNGTSDVDVSGVVPIPEGTPVTFTVTLKNASGSGTVSGDITVTDTMTNLSRPQAGWSASITCNNLPCSTYTLDVPGASPVFTIRANGATLPQNSFLTLTYTAIPTGPTGSTATIFRFRNSARIDYTDPVNGPSYIDCSGGAPLCPLETPAILFFRSLSVPFLNEIQ